MTHCQRGPSCWRCFIVSITQWSSRHDMNEHLNRMREIKNIKLKLSTKYYRFKHVLEAYHVLGLRLVQVLRGPRYADRGRGGGRHGRWSAWWRLSWRSLLLGHCWPGSHLITSLPLMTDDEVFFKQSKIFSTDGLLAGCRPPHYCCRARSVAAALAAAGHGGPRQRN